MNRLILERFAYRAKWDSGGETHGWCVLIDGEPLLERVKAFEMPLARRESDGNLAGAYDPALLAGREELMGEKCGGCGVPENSVALLGCDCGWPDCWPLAVRIEITGDSVRWSGFQQPFRDWDYSGFGPFEFELAQYEGELAKLAG